MDAKRVRSPLLLSGLALLFISNLDLEALSRIKSLTTYEENKVSRIRVYTYSPEGNFSDTFTPLRDMKRIAGSKSKAKRKPCSVGVQAEIQQSLLELLNDRSFYTGWDDVDTSIRAMSATRRPGDRPLLDLESICHTHIDTETWDHLLSKTDRDPLE
ncbi:MAG: hypothetical protein OXF25_00355 [Cyanobacteria bacterium MAG CAR3_bin_5]|nr:hypothetical protein [Cyanobacteria bacterium MAG CAR3_bin_5]